MRYNPGDTVILELLDYDGTMIVCEEVVVKGIASNSTNEDEVVYDIYPGSNSKRTNRGQAFGCSLRAREAE